MNLKSLLEMTTSISVGSNIIPQRWFTKILKVSNKKDKEFFTKIGRKNEVKKTNRSI